MPKGCSQEQRMDRLGDFDPAKCVRKHYFWNRKLPMLPLTAPEVCRIIWSRKLEEGGRGMKGLYLRDTGREERDDGEALVYWHP